MPEASNTPFTDLKAANAEVTRLSALLSDTSINLEQARTQVTALTEQNTQYQAALVKAKSHATRTIAAAGVSEPLSEEGRTSLDDNPTQGLFGLKRAIAANAARPRGPHERDQ